MVTKAKENYGQKNNKAIPVIRSYFFLLNYAVKRNGPQICH